MLKELSDLMTATPQVLISSSRGPIKQEGRLSRTPLNLDSLAAVGDDHLALLRGLPSSNATSLESLDLGLDIPASCVGECAILLGHRSPDGELIGTSRGQRPKVNLLTGYQYLNAAIGQCGTCVGVL